MLNERFPRQPFYGGRGWKSEEGNLDKETEKK